VIPHPDRRDARASERGIADGQADHPRFKVFSSSLCAQHAQAARQFVMFASLTKSFNALFAIQKKKKDQKVGLASLPNVQEEMMVAAGLVIPIVALHGVPEEIPDEANLTREGISTEGRPRSSLRRKVVKDTDSKTDSVLIVPSPTLPLTLTKCIQFLDEHALTQKGLYRVSGRVDVVAMLCGLFRDHESDITLNPPNSDNSEAQRRPLSADAVSFQGMFSNSGLLYDNDVHVVAGVVKAWCRTGIVSDDKLQPLVPYDFYSRMVGVMELADYRVRMIALQDILHSLPSPNFAILKYLSLHLGRVVQYSTVNGMSAKNLALIFGPTLVRHASEEGVQALQDQAMTCGVVEMLIDYGDWLFGPIEYEQEEDEAAEGESSLPTPELVRRASSRLLLKPREKPMESDTLLRRKQGNRNFIYLGEEESTAGSLRRSVASATGSEDGSVMGSQRSSLRQSVA